MRFDRLGWGLGLVLPVLLSAGCPDRCLRNSDCASGLACIQGQCAKAVVTPDGAAPPDLSVPDLAVSDLVVPDLVVVDMVDGGG